MDRPTPKALAAAFIFSFSQTHLMRREQIIRAIQTTLKKHGVKEAYLFGSFARGEKKYRDIDIAIRPPERTSLLDLAHMENVLEEQTHKKIDLGTIDSIHPLVRRHVNADRVALI